MGQINAIFRKVLEGLPFVLSQECYDACLADKKCGRWIWCSHSRGCDEMGTFMDSFPTGACQLNTAEMVRSLTGVELGAFLGFRGVSSGTWQSQQRTL